MSTTCTYDCKGTAPPLSPNSDITGVGVLLSFIITAAMAVFAIFLYFVMIFQPLQEPFSRNDRSPSMSFRPNPIDVFILRWLRSLPFLKGWISRAGAALGVPFTNCLVAMGDLQLVTGFSIMISGYVQLQCGLATYYWLVILELAWFSSLTHLSCLTLLRPYLIHHTTERTWRLIAMGLLAALLVVGFLFTGDYYWDSANSASNGPKIHEPAICYLGMIPPDDSTDSTLWTMIISVIMIVIGFFSRTVKLYERLSVQGFRRARSRLSIWTRGLLRAVYSWACARTSPYSLRRTVCYRPLLACFLAVRLFLDGWSSMFVELVWLIVAFVWGILRLQLTFQAANFKIFSSQLSDWTFGQVAAVVLLIGPITSAFGTFSRDKTADTQDAGSYPLLHDPRTQHAASPSSPPRSVDIDDPDNDWQLHSCVLESGLFYCVLVTLVWIEAAFRLSLSERTTLADTISSYAPVGIPVAVGGYFGVIFCSLAIEDIMGEQHRKPRILLQSVMVAVSVIANIFGPDVFEYLIYLVPAGILFYITGAFIYRVLGGRQTSRS